MGAFAGSFNLTWHDWFHQRFTDLQSAAFEIVNDCSPNHRGNLHSRAPRNRSELPMTVTELSDIAAPAMIGDSRIWNQG